MWADEIFALMWLPLLHGQFANRQMVACSVKRSGDLRVSLPQKLPASKIMAVTLQGAPAKLLHGELATAAQLPFTCLAKPPFLESSGGKPFCSQLLSASRQHPLHFLDMSLHGKTAYVP